MRLELPRHPSGASFSSRSPRGLAMALLAAVALTGAIFLLPDPHGHAIAQDHGGLVNAIEISPVHTASTIPARRPSQ